MKLRFKDDILISQLQVLTKFCYMQITESGSELWHLIALEIRINNLINQVFEY